MMTMIVSGSEEWQCEWQRRLGKWKVHGWVQPSVRVVRERKVAWAEPADAAGVAVRLDAAVVVGAIVAVYYIVASVVCVRPVSMPVVVPS